LPGILARFSSQKTLFYQTEVVISIKNNYSVGKIKIGIAFFWFGVDKTGITRASR